VEIFGNERLLPDCSYKKINASGAKAQGRREEKIRSELKNIKYNELSVTNLRC
jgi:hypothetical protein